MPNSVVGDDYKVYINGNLIPFARLVEVDESVGSRQEGYAIFEVPFIEANSVPQLAQLITLGGTWGTYDRRTNNTKILNACLPASVSVTIANRSGSRRENTVHVGVISEVKYADDATGEDIRIVSRTDNAMFGVPLSGKPTHVGPLTATIATVDHQIGQKWVFNPIIDGKQHPNCWRARAILTEPNIKEIAFLDTESIPRKFFYEPSFAAGQVAGLEYWRIQLAIWFLCHTLNAQQKFFVNPKWSEIRDVVKGDDDLDSILNGVDPGYMLQNFELPLNASLPEALDLILGSFGYFWYTKSIPGNPQKQRIAFGKRSRGDSSRLRYLYKPPRVNDFRNPVCEEHSLTVDRSNRYASEVLVVGGPIVVETTLELMPAWDPAYDNASLGSLTLEKVKGNSNLIDVRRKWAANETGEYNDWLTESHAGRSRLYKGPRLQLLGAIREAMASADVTGDFAKRVLASSLNRRFKAQKCLTLVSSGVSFDSGKALGLGESIGIGHGQVLVEVKKRDSYSTAGWREIGHIRGGGSWQLLENEIGIYFTGDMPPDRLRPQTWQVRMTFSIELPYCLHALARVKSTPNTEFLSYARPHVAHEPTRFNFRFVSSYSQFYSSQKRKDEVDDTASIKSYAEQLIEAWSSATCEGSADIQGLTTYYQLGDRLAGVFDDNVSFDVSANKVQQYPSITGVRYLPQEQRTIVRFGLYGREDLL